MPQLDDAHAIRWEIEADYFAVSEEGRETALITSTQMDSCIGSSQYSICHEGLATEGFLAWHFSSGIWFRPGRFVT